MFELNICEFERCNLHKVIYNSAVLTFGLFMEIVLFDISDSIAPGISTSCKNAIRSLCGNTRVIDVLFLIPRRVIHRSITKNISALNEGDIATIIVTPISHSDVSKSKKRPYRIKCKTESASPIEIVYFSPPYGYLKRIFPINSKKIISGRVSKRGKVISISHPEKVLSADHVSAILKPEVVYRLRSGVSLRQISELVNKGLSILPKKIDEWIPDNVISKYDLPGFLESISQIHKIKTIEEISPDSKFIKRLAYDELLAYQVSMGVAHRKLSMNTGRCIYGNEKVYEIFLSKLGFILTHGQESIIKEIFDDQSSSGRMIRLLQGDVGSGKTAIALAAIEIFRILVEHKPYLWHLPEVHSHAAFTFS